MKDIRLTIRISKEESEQIERKAKENHMNTSEFARFCIDSAIRDNYVPKIELVKLVHRILLVCQNHPEIRNKIDKEVRKWL